MIAMSTPAAAGPAMSAIPKLTDSIAFAVARSSVSTTSAGTIDGTPAQFAILRKPYRPATANRCADVTSPVTAASGTDRTAAPKTTLTSARNRRRSKRSRAAPMRTPPTNTGAVATMTNALTSRGEPERV